MGGGPPGLRFTCPSHSSRSPRPGPDLLADAARQLPSPQKSPAPSVPPTRCPRKHSPFCWSSMPSVRRPVRVVYFVEGYSFGGVERHLLHLLDALDRQRFEPVVLGVMADELEEELERSPSPACSPGANPGQCGHPGIHPGLPGDPAARPVVFHAMLSHSFAAQYALLRPSPFDPVDRHHRPPADAVGNRAAISPPCDPAGGGRRGPAVRVDQGRADPTGSAARLQRDRGQRDRLARAVLTRGGQGATGNRPRRDRDRRLDAPRGLEAPRADRRCRSPAPRRRRRDPRRGPRRGAAPNIGEGGGLRLPGSAPTRSASFPPSTSSSILAPRTISPWPSWRPWQRASR